MPKSEWKRELEVAFRAADKANQVLLKHYGHLTKIEEKFRAGLVTEADRESEDVIKAEILQAFPGDSIWGEETGLSSSPADSQRMWMVDPLDGTTNYVHRFPMFCISIGLEVDGILRVGVVDAPKLNQRFHAVSGGGAFLNGEKISTSGCSRFQDALFATGFSSQDQDLEPQFHLLRASITKARGIRRAGSAALDLCYVAHGVFDGFWERNLAVWDTAAGAIIAREAGAIVTTMEGANFRPSDKSILACTPAVHAEVLAEMRAANLSSPSKS